MAYLPSLVVMTKPKGIDGAVKYVVYKRSLHLDLLTLINFTDPPAQRRPGILWVLCGWNDTRDADKPEGSTVDSRYVYPMTLHHNGRAGGLSVLYAESSQSRAEWQERLTNTLVRHKAAQESNKVFRFETLIADAFLGPSMATSELGWDQSDTFTGRVTCSAPFSQYFLSNLV